MLDDFVLTNRKRKFQEFLTAIKKELKQPFPEQDFLDYMKLAETSPSHRDDSIQTVVRDVVWPMLNGTYLIERDENGEAISYASWGFFSEKVSLMKLELKKEKLVREDYGSGEIVWHLDVIAKPGFGPKKMIKKLLEKKEELGLGKTEIRFRRWYATKNQERINKVTK